MDLREKIYDLKCSASLLEDCDALVGIQKEIYEPHSLKNLDWLELRKRSMSWRNLWASVAEQPGLVRAPKEIWITNDSMIEIDWSHRQKKSMNWSIQPYSSQSLDGSWPQCPISNSNIWTNIRKDTLACLIRIRRLRWIARNSKRNLWAYSLSSLEGL